MFELRELVRGRTGRFGPVSGQALVTVKGRPGVCLKCFKPGHLRKNCPVQYCQKCRTHTAAHITTSCPGLTLSQIVANGAQAEVLLEHEMHAEDDDGFGLFEDLPTEQKAPTPKQPRAPRVRESDMDLTAQLVHIQTKAVDPQSAALVSSVKVAPAATLTADAVLAMPAAVEAAAAAAVVDMVQANVLEGLTPADDQTGVLDHPVSPPVTDTYFFAWSIC
jgi:hypothetical protein